MKPLATFIVRVQSRSLGTPQLSLKLRGSPPSLRGVKGGRAGRQADSELVLHILGAREDQPHI